MILVDTCIPSANGEMELRLDNARLRRELDQKGQLANILAIEEGDARLKSLKMVDSYAFGQPGQVQPGWNSTGHVKSNFLRLPAASTKS
jgi:hypothetical protein